LKLYEALNKSVEHIEPLISCWDKSDKIRYVQILENLKGMTSITNYRIMKLYVPNVLELLDESTIIGISRKSETNIIINALVKHIS
jgi:hypothetical protein